MEFYDILKDLMFDNGLDLKTLAELSNIDLSTLYYYRENKKSPDLNTLIKLSDYFNCSIQFLLGLTDNSEISKKNGKKFIDIYEKLLRDNKTNNYKVSKILGISRARYYDWKKGVLPNINTLKELSKHFNVSIDYLIGRSDEE